MKIKLSKEESYPVISENQSGELVEIPKPLLTKWRRVAKQFWDINAELVEVLETAAGKWK